MLECETRMTTSPAESSSTDICSQRASTRPACWWIRYAGNCSGVIASTMVHCSPAMRHDTNPVLHFNLNRRPLAWWLPSVLLQCASAAALAQPADSASLTRVDLAKPDP